MPNILDYLFKSSWNAKNQRTNLTPQQVEQRRNRYLQSIGLKPIGGQEFPEFPQSPPDSNILPYNNKVDFDNAHEGAHAMMTPPLTSIREWQDFISQPASTPGHPGYSDEPTAGALEHKIDRRSGVDPSSSMSSVRSSYPVSIDTAASNGFIFPHPKSEKVRTSNSVNPDRLTQRILPEPIQANAQQYIDKFDNGAKFNNFGEIEKPTGIDAKINARGLKKL